MHSIMFAVVVTKWWSLIYAVILFIVGFSPFLFTSQNTCKSSPCLNNGKCQYGFTDKAFRCLCTAGFEGELCEKGDVRLIAGPTGSFVPTHRRLTLKSKKNCGSNFLEGNIRGTPRETRMGIYPGRNVESII